MVRFTRLTAAALMAFAVVGCAARSAPTWIVMVNNDTDYPISVDLEINGAAHHWVVPRYDNAWQIVQVRDAISDAAITVYEPETCEVAYQGDLPSVSSVVFVEPGLPTVDQPFSKQVRVWVGRKGSLAPDDVTLPESAACVSSTTSP